MSDTKITRVIFRSDYKLEIFLENGQSFYFDIEPKLVTARFQELSDQEVFMAGQVLDGKRICWETGAELSLDEIIISRNMQGE